MNRRVCMRMVLSGIFMLSAGLARAQHAAPLPPPPMAMLQGPGPEAGMIGERIELLGFEGMHGGKVGTGVPFSAVAVSESAQTLADGNHIARKTNTNLFRDSQGRFRKEVTLPAIGPLATSGQPKSFEQVFAKRLDEKGSAGFPAVSVSSFVYQAEVSSVDSKTVFLQKPYARNSSGALVPTNEGRAVLCDSRVTFIPKSICNIRIVERYPKWEPDIYVTQTGYRVEIPTAMSRKLG